MGAGARREVAGVKFGRLGGKEKLGIKAREREAGRSRRQQREAEIEGRVGARARRSGLKPGGRETVLGDWG